MDASSRESNWIKCIARMLLFAARGRDTKTSRCFIKLARALKPQNPPALLQKASRLRFALGYATCATAECATLPHSAQQGDGWNLSRDPNLNLCYASKVVFLNCPSNMFPRQKKVGRASRLDVFREPSGRDLSPSGVRCEISPRK